jgi:formylglycine-generating enzyme required for sulfatase activity
MVQVFIPAGDFWMGGPAEEPNVMPDEQPRHKVSLDAFWMDLTEVTNAMFAQFVADTGYRTEAEQNGSSAVWNGGGWDYVSGANWRTPFGPGSNAPNNYPVIQVSWNDASAYCEWAERRLPTEAEWEKAASGPDNFLYPWGNAEPRSSLANYADNVGSLVPVGSYPDGASGYGVLDMGGNVYEWTADWHGSDYYSNSPPKNPTGPTSGKYKVIHGGSWQLDALRLRVFGREVSGPNAANSNIGFRCVQSDR